MQGENAFTTKFEDFGRSPFRDLKNMGGEQRLQPENTTEVLDKILKSLETPKVGNNGIGSSFTKGKCFSRMSPQRRNPSNMENIRNRVNQGIPTYRAPSRVAGSMRSSRRGSPGRRAPLETPKMYRQGYDDGMDMITSAVPNPRKNYGGDAMQLKREYIENSIARSQRRGGQFNPVPSFDFPQNDSHRSSRADHHDIRKIMGSNFHFQGESNDEYLGKRQSFPISQDYYTIGKQRMIESSESQDSQFDRTYQKDPEMDSRRRMLKEKFERETRLMESRSRSRQQTNQRQ